MPLQAWAQEHNVQVLAVQPPGRAQRMREPQHASLQDMATALLPIVAHELCSRPYALVAHSVGTWAAFELLRLALSKGMAGPPACGAM